MGPGLGQVSSSIHTHGLDENHLINLLGQSFDLSFFFNGQSCHLFKKLTVKVGLPHKFIVMNQINARTILSVTCVC